MAVMIAIAAMSATLIGWFLVAAHQAVYALQQTMQGGWSPPT
jgi:hypothetical protein